MNAYKYKERETFPLVVDWAFIQFETALTFSICNNGWLYSAWQVLNVCKNAGTSAEFKEHICRQTNS